MTTPTSKTDELAKKVRARAAKARASLAFQTAELLDEVADALEATERTARADEEAMREVESIIELADHRASACDGPVGRTELSVKDLRRIYRLMKKRLKAREKGAVGDGDGEAWPKDRPITKPGVPPQYE